MKNAKRIRHQLVTKQRNRCCYCNRLFGRKGTSRGATIEHVKPRSRGGTNAHDNLKAACLHCNQHRGKQMNQARQSRQPAKLAQTRTAVPLADTISMDPVSPITS